MTLANTLDYFHNYLDNHRGIDYDTHPVCYIGLHTHYLNSGLSVEPIRSPINSECVGFTDSSGYNRENP
jgi:hypothetical protein